MPKRIAVVVSHPIQHFCPQYASWSAVPGIELKVFFASSQGLKAYVDPGFGRTVKWSNLSFDYPHEFLAGAGDRGTGADVDSADVERALEEFRPHVVIGYGYGQPLQRRVIRWARRSGIPLGMISDSELRRKRSLAKRAAKAVFLPKILAHIDWFLTVGDANEQYYRLYGATDQQFIRMSFPIDRNGFDEAAKDHAARRADIRGKFGIADDDIVVLMVGKLNDSKRQKDLVDFIKRHEETAKTVKVMLVGTGPAQAGLEREAAGLGDRIIFAGFVDPEGLADYYYSSDIYAHCSEVDAHSLAISEAIYAGLPIIVSDACGSFGPSDDVRHGLNGFVYRCGVHDELARLIMQLAADHDLRRGMGQQSRQIGLRHQEQAHELAIRQLAMATGPMTE